MFGLFKKITPRKIRLWERKGMIDKILPFIYSDTYSIRIASIRSIGNIGNESCISSLISLLDNNNEFIRTEAEKALLQIGASEEVKKIIDTSKIYWQQKSIDKKQKTEETEMQVDKDLYGWKGRIAGNISKLKRERGKVNKPIHWG